MPECVLGGESVLWRDPAPFWCASLRRQQEFRIADALSSSEWPEDEHPEPASAAVTASPPSPRPIRVAQEIVVGHALLRIKRPTPFLHLMCRLLGLGLRRRKHILGRGFCRDLG